MKYWKWGTIPTTVGYNPYNRVFNEKQEKQLAEYCKTTVDLNVFSEDEEDKEENNSGVWK